MFYYDILVSSPQFHGKEALTYESSEALQKGQLVRVPMRKKFFLGVVVAKAQKPSYKTKPISNIITSEALPSHIIELLEWLYKYYPAPLGLVAQQALPSSLLVTKRLEAPETYKSSSPESLPALSKQQQAVVDSIDKSSGSTFLIHGDTGTGKTRVYMELARDVLLKNRSVLVVTPEIGLVPQLVQSFQKYFQEEVVILHSNQTTVERRKQWLKVVHSRSPQIIIGPRSALFAPIKDLGLVVVDEAHDTAYKQDQSPRYNALRVAGKLSSLAKSLLVFGTATPLVSEYWLAEQTDTPILRLNELPSDRQIERSIVTVPLSDRDHFSQSTFLSNELLGSIENAISNKQQSLVFLNRRGTARLVICQDCGWQALCPKCDLPLTYHGDKHIVRCHTCGFKIEPPTKCPDCSGHDIIFKSIGTKSVVTELQRIFPKAVIKRFDTDNTTHEKLEANYPDVAEGKVDILVGTQMITKGLDLPKLSVVGVVLADTSLYLPDYSSEERTYQILNQVIGRVGRGHTKGIVIVQTYQPNSPSVQAAVHAKWSQFYKDQLRERQAFGFPPFYFFLKLTCSRASSTTAQKAAEALALNLQSAGYRIEVVGPTPSFYQKVGGKYQWQLIVKAKQRQELIKVIEQLPNGWTYDIDPLTLL